MKSIQQIEEENNPKTRIKKYMKKYHEKTGRNVIGYYSSFLIKDDEKNYIDTLDINGLITVMQDLDKTKGLDLILHTPGGSVSATESIIDYLHGVFGEDIRAIIPQISMSGGTMIACSCKEILMGKHSSLGPVDPQIFNYSAKNIIKEFKLAKKEMAEHPELIPYWTVLLDKYEENILIECENAIEWSEYILEKSLKYSMFDEKDEVHINKIKFELITSDSTKNHSQNLSAERCRKIGLKIRNLEDDKILHDLVLSVHHAFLSYFNHENACKLIINQNGDFFSFD